jgi:hypothetical protein
MTRSKLEFATILASMRGQNEDPKQLAEGMTLRKLCYEIEKLEQEQESRPKDETTPQDPKDETTPQDPKDEKPKGPRPFWSWLLADSDEEDS